MSLIDRPFLNCLWDISFVMWFVTEYILAHSFVANIALAFFLMMCCLKFFLISTFRKRIPGLFILYGGFVLVCYLNIALGYSLNDSLSSSLLSTLIKNGVFIVLMYYYITRRGIKRFNKVFVFSAICGSIVAFIYSFITTGSFMLRSDSSSFNANMMAIAAAFAISIIICSKKKKNKYDIASIALLLLLCVVAGTRKALIAVVMIVAIYFVLNKPEKFIKNAVFVVVLVCSVYLALINVPFLYDMIGNRIESLLSLLSGDEGDSSAMTRAKYIELGLKHFKSSPWWGHGINCFQTLNESSGTYSHNNYIELLFGAGIMGVVSYYSMHLLILVRCIKRYFFAKTPQIALCIAFILAVLFMDIAVVSYFERASIVFVIICYALLESDDCENKEIFAESK